MKANKMRDLTNDELARKLHDFKDELFNLRFQMATNQLDNPMRLREVRKNIARVQSVLKERELAVKKGK